MESVNATNDVAPTKPKNYCNIIQCISWIQYKYTSLYFSILMLLETVNFISDCVQLNAVNQNFNCMEPNCDGLCGTKSNCYTEGRYTDLCEVYEGYTVSYYNAVYKGYTVSYTNVKYCTLKRDKNIDCYLYTCIWFCTIFFFAFEAFIILGKIITSSVAFSDITISEDERIQNIVEFPLIGFILMFWMLTKEQRDRYYFINKEKENGKDIFNTILGLHSKQHPLYQKISTRFVCMYNLDPIQLGQAWWFIIVIPFTEIFYQILFSKGNICSVFCIPVLALIVVPVTFVLSLTYFGILFVTMFLLMFWYGEKLYISRVIHDFPNIVLTLLFITNTSSANSSVFSVICSLILFCYYFTKMVYHMYKDTRARLKEKQPIFKLEGIYGELTQTKLLTLLLAYSNPFLFFMWCGSGASDKSSESCEC